MAFIQINGIDLEIKKTWLYEPQPDDRNPSIEEGERCVELVSKHGKYRLVTTMASIAEKLR